MKVPFFDLQRLYREQRTEIDQAVLGVLGGDRYILGSRCETFERDLGRYLRPTAPFEAVTCNSGTDALVLSLLAIGIQRGDEVICPSHTAIPTITAIRAAGGRPIFVDVDSRTWLLNVDAALKAVTARTRAIVSVHLYGNMVDVPTLQAGLRRIDRPDVAVVEDVAQAFASTLHGTQAGTLGRIGAFSFYPTKNIGAVGDGGAVVCSRAEDAQKVRMLRNYGQKDRYNAEISGGMNSRMDEIQAAILSVRLQRLGRWNEMKETQLNHYKQGLQRLPIAFQEITPGCKPAWHLCVIAMESAKERDLLQKYLAEHEVQTLIHYPHPTHLQVAFREEPPSHLQITESLAERILSLPLNPGLSTDEQDWVIDRVCAFFSRGRS